MACHELIRWIIPHILIELAALSATIFGYVVIKDDGGKRSGSIPDETQKSQKRLPCTVEGL